MKRILIDFTQIPLQKVGVGVYACNTFEKLIKIDHDNQYVFIIQNDDDFDSYHQNNIRIKKVKASIFRGFFFRFILEQCILPFYCFKYDIDILHSLHYSFPFFLKKRTKRIVTIHDLTFFIYPQLHTFFKRHYFRLFTKLSASKADKIICVSQSTASDLKRFFPNMLASVHTVPLAVENSINFSLTDTQTTLLKYGLSNNSYILFIGTLEPRKNINLVIRAFSVLKQYNLQYKLVIVGKKGWFYDSIFTLIKDLNLENDVIFTDFISPKEKYILLAKCNLFVYPSLYEGFGLPVLEAMSYGKPIITSNISSMPEVAGNAAVLIDPDNVAELALAMKNLLSDTKLANQYAQKAVDRAGLFTWEKTAELTLNVYNS